MNVNDKREQALAVEFSELSIGDVYESDCGTLCIKTSDEDRDGNCICFEGDVWREGYELADGLTFPLKSTLEIER